ncbi:hypothetical protein G6514_005729 [Epicoccum nigrum]|nr:hypothetical protein G6514_005729 [Epicoccum nigrum]
MSSPPPAPLSSPPPAPLSSSKEAKTAAGADETLQAKVKVAKERARNAEQKRTAANGKIEFAELRAATAEDKVKLLEEQLELSQEATKSAQAHNSDAAQRAQDAVDDASKKIKAADNSRALSVQIQQQLLRSTTAARDQANEFKATIVRQEKEIARMSRLQDDLAKTKADLDANKLSLDQWVQGCEERDTIIRKLEERIFDLEVMCAAKHEMIK